MAIKIKLINCAIDPTIQKPEESAASELKKEFEQEFSKYPNAKGTLYILRSISIFGYKIRDIDLLLIGKFENFSLRNKVNTKNYGDICNLNINSFICMPCSKITNPICHRPDIWFVQPSYCKD